MSRARAIGAAAITIGLAACTSPSAPAWCAAWGADACTLPPLAAIAVPTLASDATEIVLAADDADRVLAALALRDGVGVLEEAADGLHARAWPTGLDVHVDMPALATGPGSVAAIAVRASADGVTGDVLVARRAADGSWREPARSEVLSSPPRAYEPRVAFDASGALLLVTNQYAATRDGYGVAVSSAPSVDATFVRPRDADDVLSPPIFFSNSPRPALDASGAAIVTWYQSLGGALRVLFAERASGDGTFVPADPASALSIDLGAVDSSAPPDPACNERGVCAVAWGQEDGLGGVAVYLATRAAGGAFDRPTSLDDHVSLGNGVARDVRTRVAPDGAVLVVWSERVGVREHVFLARRALGAAHDAADVRVVSSIDVDAYAPSLAVSSGGAIAIAFVERASSDRVVLRRGAVDGSLADPETMADLDAAAPVVAFSPRSTRFVVAWIEGGRPRFAAAAISARGP